MKSYEEDLKERIAELEVDESQEGRMNRKDYIVAGLLILFCLILVIGGAFLG